MPDGIELRARGRTISTWKTASIARSMEVLAGVFSLTAFAPDGWPFEESDRVELFADGERLMIGNIDSIAVTLNAEEHRVEAEGRDLTGDLIDSSIDGLPSEFRDITIRELVGEISFGGYRIPVRSELGSDLPRFSLFALQPGETAYEAIERACRLTGVLAITGDEGEVVLTRPSDQRLPATLVQGGGDVISARGGYSVAERFSFYRVLGQHSGSDDVNGAAAASPAGSAEDAAVRPTRVRVILAEAEVDDATCEQRAQWEASMAAARANTFEVTVRGWRIPPTPTSPFSAQALPPLWHVNRLVAFDFPAFRYRGDLLISSVRFDVGEQGMLTTLGLVRPDAYRLEPRLSLESDPGAAVLHGSQFGGVDR
ncbi:MAG: hypothetical protein GY711_11335 [bacterium]|nr:hypothetical protein [bacterium]